MEGRPWPWPSYTPTPTSPPERRACFPGVQASNLGGITAPQGRSGPNLPNGMSFTYYGSETAPNEEMLGASRPSRPSLVPPVPSLRSPSATTTRAKDPARKTPAMPPDPAPSMTCEAVSQTRNRWAADTEPQMTGLRQGPKPWPRILPPPSRSRKNSRGGDLTPRRTWPAVSD